MLLQILDVYIFWAKAGLIFKMKHNSAANTDRFDADKDPNDGL
jgi:hypothetical protein